MFEKQKSSLRVSPVLTTPKQRTERFLNNRTTNTELPSKLITELNPERELIILQFLALHGYQEVYAKEGLFNETELNLLANKHYLEPRKFGATTLYQPNRKEIDERRKELQNIIKERKVQE